MTHRTGRVARFPCVCARLRVLAAAPRDLHRIGTARSSRSRHETYHISGGGLVVHPLAPSLAGFETAVGPVLREVMERLMSYWPAPRCGGYTYDVREI